MVLVDPQVARALAAPARVAILRHLQEAGEARGVEELAEVVKLHVNTVRSHLDMLADVGLVSRDGRRRRGPGRPQVLYRVAAADAVGAGAADQSAGRSADGGITGGGITGGGITGDRATGGGVAADDGWYRGLVEVLAGEFSTALPDPRPVAVRAGQRWVEALEQAGWAPDVTEPEADDTARVVALLDKLGFAPQTEPLGDRIYLRACPFGVAARRSPEILCEVHLGLIRGAYARLGSRISVAGCEPFVRDDLCVVHLAREGC